MAVTAQIDGNVCGQTQTISDTLHGQAQIVYTLNVYSADGLNGCGQPGKQVTFQINGQDVPTSVSWNNDHAREVTLNATAIASDIYLPVLMNSFIAAPDLVVTNITASTNNVQITLKNQGTTPVVEGFWVDVYLDPNPVPSQVNQIWNNLASEGLVWGVEGSALPLQPGQELTLTLNDSYYWPSESNFSGTMVASTQVYAQVDSVNTNPNFSYGGVLENHEAIGQPYNNIRGPVLSTAGVLAAPLAGHANPVGGSNLPPR
ncbi:MAG: hypothetical protein GY934_13570 [Gammaproteobacteria bacterium]|nr:hypothetical protein [Gammaproteobacteria bacterium]